jgi:hypothetical protein
VGVFLLILDKFEQSSPEELLRKIYKRHHRKIINDSWFFRTLVLNICKRPDCPKDILFLINAEANLLPKYIANMVARALSDTTGGWKS